MHVSPPPHSKHLPTLLIVPLLRIRILQIYPLMARNIECKVSVLEFLPFRRFRHMQPHHTLTQRALDVKVHIQMLGAGFVLGQSRRNAPVPRPTIPRALSIRSDLLRIAQELHTPIVLLNTGVGLVEMMRFAVHAEDFLVQEPAHSTGCDHADEDDGKVEGLLRAPGQFFAGGEFGPWDTAIVAGEGDGFAGCAGIS